MNVKNIVFFVARLGTLLNKVDQLADEEKQPAADSTIISTHMRER